MQQGIKVYFSQVQASKKTPFEFKVSTEMLYGLGNTELSSCLLFVAIAASGSKIQILKLRTNGALKTNAKNMKVDMYCNVFQHSTF